MSFEIELLQRNGPEFITVLSKQTPAARAPGLNPRPAAGTYTA